MMLLGCIETAIHMCPTLQSEFCETKIRIFKVRLTGPCKLPFMILQLSFSIVDTIVSSIFEMSLWLRPMSQAPEHLEACKCMCWGVNESIY